MMNRSVVEDRERRDIESALAELGVEEIGNECQFALYAEAIGLRRTIRAYVIEQVLKNQEHQETKYRAPVVGFASADDPLWEELAATVRTDHFTPRALLSEARTVLSIFLPYSEVLIAGNLGGTLPSEEWGHSYTESNQVLRGICEGLARMLSGLGFSTLLDIPPTPLERQVRYGGDLPNRWSQRSVAYIAGLGTFGVNHAIITERGCAGRLASMITSAHVQPSERPTVEACPAIEESDACDACIRNCPAEVLSHGDFDRDGCMEYLYLFVYKKQRGPGCGKCLVDVPCAIRIPGRK